jgi:nucleotide-binding universal stress UspA family protein
MTRTREASRNGSLASPSSAAPILVGFDGAEGGHDALELGRLLATVRGCRCSVAVPDAKRLAAEARAALEDEQAKVHAIGILSPALLLVRRAEQEGAGTLVLGSTHKRGRMGRALIGSVAVQVLHKAPCEVVIAPRGYAATHHDGLDKIAVDGESKLALSRAEELARQAGAEIELLRDTNAPAEACGSDVDLLVADSRRPWDRFVLSPATKQLITAAPCPVLVTPLTR